MQRCTDGTKTNLGGWGYGGGSCSWILQVPPYEVFQNQHSNCPDKTIKAKTDLLICFMECRKQKSPERGVFVKCLAEAVTAIVDNSRTRKSKQKIVSNLPMSQNLEHALVNPRFRSEN